MNNKRIFKELYPDKNILLHDLTKDEKIHIIKSINNYYLEYRPTLNLKKEITFGIEIETEYAKQKEIENELECYLEFDWKKDRDNTLNKGTEIISPILRDKKSTWYEIKDICNILQKYSHISKRAGGHIHVGSQILGTKIDNWYNFFYLYGVYEHILFRFGYGEYLNRRETMVSYSKRISNQCIQAYDNHKYNKKNDFEDLISLLRWPKSSAISILNLDIFNYYKEKKDNTIEARFFNGTLNPIIWQNNINLITKMLNYCNSDNFNLDIISNRYKLNKENKTNDYNMIYLDQALEFCDLIFDNNLDKIYFLRQYIKDFKISQTYKKAKQFTI